MKLYIVLCYKRLPFYGNGSEDVEQVLKEIEVSNLKEAMGIAEKIAIPELPKDSVGVPEISICEYYDGVDWRYIATLQANHKWHQHWENWPDAGITSLAKQLSDAEIKSYIETWRRPPVYNF